MPVGTPVRSRRKGAIEVIEVLSSEEEPATPRRSTRKPLTNRKNVLAGSTPSSRRSQTTGQTTVKAVPTDVKPIIISDDEDIKPSVPRPPSIRPEPSTTKHKQASRPDVNGPDVNHPDVNHPDVKRPSPSGSMASGGEVKVEKDGAFTLDTLTRELDDIASTLKQESQSTSSQAAISDLFSADSPECKPDTDRWSSPPVSPRSPLRGNPACPIAESSGGEEDDDEPELRPAFWRDDPAAFTANNHDSPHNPVNDHGPLAPFTPRSTASRNRFEKLQSLIQARQTPTTSRRARRAVEVKSEMSEQDDEEDCDRASAAGAYDLERHYDTSLGSLRDFIVSDSDVSDGEIEPIAIFLDSDSEEEGKEDVPKGGKSPSRTCSHDLPEDDFDVTDGGMLVYTPVKKTARLPDLSELYLGSSDDEPGSSRPTKPARRSRTAPSHPTSRSRQTDPNWTKTREKIAQAMFDDLNRRVFEGKLGEATIEWNKRLLTTAGVAKATRERQSDGTRKTKAKIELSDKVLATEEQINNTVAHEMCHVAGYVINDAWNHGHGKIFKAWGRKVMRARPDIEVTTTHNYTIEFKYQWKCSNEKCVVVYRRHSKSIDTQKEACWWCKSKLVPLFATKSATPFQAYLKDNMKLAKAAMRGAKHGDVMRALSERWKEAPEGDHQAYWRGRAAE